LSRPVLGEVRAVIDVGSNSVLTLVAAWDGDGWRTVHESSCVTGLGEGTKTTGLLSDAAMARTLAAVERGFADARRLGAARVEAWATMAARIASNTEDFLRLASAQGTPIGVLSGEREAELGFLAVANDPAFRDAERLTIIDVGGHSTELVAAHRSSGGWALDVHKSYPIGTLALRSGVLCNPTPGPAERMRAVSDMDEAIGLAFLPGKCGTTVALGATGTNLITIRERMTSWEPSLVHGRYLLYEEVGRSAGWLLDLNDEERAAIVGIEPGRERSLHIGVLILERFLYAARSERCWVSTRGWRHALLETSVGL